MFAAVSWNFAARTKSPTTNFSVDIVGGNRFGSGRHPWQTSVPQPFFSRSVHFWSAARTLAADKPQQTGVSSERLDITFDYQRGGIASSQYVIWVEDAIGRSVRTIFVTRFTATRGFSERPDAVPTWVARFNPSQMTSAQIDAVSGATPSNGSLHYTWDGKDNQGKPVPAGTYTVFLEGTLYWNTRVLYSAKVQWGNGNAGQAPVTVHKTGTSERNQNMIANVRFSRTTTKP